MSVLPPKQTCPNAAGTSALCQIWSCAERQVAGAGLSCCPMGQMRRIPRSSAVRVDNNKSADRPHMVAGQAGAGVTIVHEPFVAANMTHQHHHMMVAHCRHSRGRRAAWEFPTPVRSQIEFGANMAEYIARCFAATERMRTTGGSAADDRAVIIGIGHMLDCGSIRIGEIGTAAVIANNPAVGYSVESVTMFCIGGSRKGG